MCFVLLLVEFIVLEVKWVTFPVLFDVALCFFPFELLSFLCEFLTLGRLMALFEADY